MNSSTKFNPGARAGQLTGSPGIRRASFTLLEVLVAALVCGIALSAILGSLSEGMRVVSRARETSAAISVLDEEMERIRTLSYSSVSALSGSTTKTVPGMGPTFTLAYSVSAFNLLNDGATYRSTNRVTRVTLTVTWTSVLDHRSLSRKLTGYIANGGINSL